MTAAAAALGGWAAVLRGAAIAGVLGLYVWATWGYAADVYRRPGDPRRADPRLASWVIWAGAMGIGAAGALRVGAWASATLGAAGSAGCLVILAAGITHGDRETGWLDLAAAGLGGAGLVLLAGAFAWPDKVPMAAAIGAAVATDIAAFAPTWVNAWQAGEESPGPYVVFALAAVVALAATGWGNAAGLVSPAYEFAACLLAAALAAAGRRRAASSPVAARVEERRAAVEAVRQAERVRGVLDACWVPAMAGRWHSPGPEPLAAELAGWYEPGPATGLVWESPEVHH